VEASSVEELNFGKSVKVGKAGDGISNYGEATKIRWRLVSSEIVEKWRAK
jgi:hypothetical protein